MTIASEITEAELVVLNALTEAWNEFVVLPVASAHPDDAEEFKLAIHAAQRIVLTRVARRCNPTVLVRADMGTPEAKA